MVQYAPFLLLASHLNRERRQGKEATLRSIWKKKKVRLGKELDFFPETNTSSFFFQGMKTTLLSSFFESITSLPPSVFRQTPQHASHGSTQLLFESYFCFSLKELRVEEVLAKVGKCRGPLQAREPGKRRARTSELAPCSTPYAPLPLERNLFELSMCRWHIHDVQIMKNCILQYDLSQKAEKG